MGNVDCDRAADPGHERLSDVLYLVEKAPLAWVTGKRRPKFGLLEGAARSRVQRGDAELAKAVISTSTLGPAAVAVVSPATGRPSTLIGTPSRT